MVNGLLWLLFHAAFPWQVLVTLVPITASAALNAGGLSLETATVQQAGAPLSRVVKFPGGQVTIDKVDRDERVRVADSGGHITAESFCPAESGTYDQLHSFFKEFKAAVISTNPDAVVGLVRFPLRVNGTHVKKVKSRTDLLRKYKQVFTEQVLKDIREAEPAAVFCRDGAAMIGNGMVWVSADKGRVAVDVVNP